MSPPRKALILGLTGGFGRTMAATLARRGFAIHALVRDPARITPDLSTAVPGLVLHAGDARDSDAIAGAAIGATVIVHAANPRNYKRWREEAIPMLTATIAAAERTGARILFPGNTYVFSPSSGDCVDETVPHTPATRKGTVRRDMEAMLAAAARDRGVRSIILRAGDFFGPDGAGGWFTGAVATKGRDTKAVFDVGAPGVGHAWAYVPDLAEAAARLIDREAALDTFEVIHFAGHWLEPGRRMAEAAQVALRPRLVPIKRFSWLQVRLGALAVPFLREALEMRWLWDHPLRLDNRKLERLIGPEPRTPLPDAIAATLAVTAHA